MHLQRLMEQIPLPPGWSAPQVFEGQVNIANVKFSLMGLASQNDHPEKTEIVGSAASCDFAQPDKRAEDLQKIAYIELLERISTFEFIENRTNTFMQGVNVLTNEQRNFPMADVFKVSPRPHHIQYIKSNGVAAHTHRLSAQNNAVCELIEREMILRSWHNERPAREVSSSKLSSTLPQDLTILYDFRFFSFEDNDFIDYHTTACFAFPKKDNDTPLSYGFKCRKRLSDSLEGAYSECIQRLGFLYGEEIPKVEPPFSPTADFHQEYFLWPGSHHLLKEWLYTPHQEQKIKQEKPLENLWLFDITPLYLSHTQFFIYKAYCPDFRTPFFGLTDLTERPVHPIA